ncbi:MAG: 1-(5-phosphoribosyl)-5-[(5-phosphoribosylamino)methylideneamino]imidazole-4-carboxamide isomerase [Clostridia bacterium]|nr:1-(5-phosphoribosyl)-5-[(5-phosphoribosylamino)methylideneamino]imidazole-4-carboxamide isomerase [Bacillota bacterium]MDA8210460.1 1-(5-phosphoribosyl)-5-[(5-phosphoribosylamino)methylideneamino]imidazole-4-carboxamide isomerase [Clostridia bacterium]
MRILPAIDLREGKCVRLVEGKIENETIFSDDPVAVAQSWQDLGAQILHLVDLDGAFAGHPHNLEVIKEIVRTVKIPVQLGGGIRTLETVEQLLSLGVQRVVLGTVAINKPELVAEACAKYGDRVVVGIDAKDGLVAIEGWEATVEKTTLELAREMEKIGVKRVVFTDVRRDGTLKGPNIESIRELAQNCNLSIVASGGVSSLDDIKALKELESLGVDEVIVGKALYTGAVSLDDVLAIAR